jgi:hypothetical protein
MTMTQNLFPITTDELKQRLRTAADEIGCVIRAIDSGLIVANETTTPLMDHLFTAAGDISEDAPSLVQLCEDAPWVERVHPDDIPYERDENDEHRLGRHELL